MLVSQLCVGPVLTCIYLIPLSCTHLHALVLLVSCTHLCSPDISVLYSYILLNLILLSCAHLYSPDTYVLYSPILTWCFCRVLTCTCLILQCTYRHSPDTSIYLSILTYTRTRYLRPVLTDTVPTGYFSISIKTHVRVLKPSIFFIDTTSLRQVRLSFRTDIGGMSENQDNCFIWRHEPSGSFVIGVLDVSGPCVFVQVRHFTRRTDHLQIDHRQIDHLVPSLPLGDAVQDLCSTDPTQGTCPTDHVRCTASTRQHEPDHTNHTDHTR